MDPSAARVAVTGAAGFIGGAVRRRLAEEGVADIVGLDVAPGAGVVACDVTDPAQVAAALDGVTHVVHAAARVSDWGPMEEFVRVNVRGTRNVLDAADAAGVRRVVHVSSVAVWGYEFRADLDEDAPPRTCGVPYIDTKAASELLARSRGATIVRPGDVYGPGSIPWAVRPLEGMKSGLLRLPGRAAGIMTPVYVDDLADAIVRALLLPAGEGQVFTCWDGSPVTAAEFFGHYARMLGRERAPTLPRAVLHLAAAAQEAAARVTGAPPMATRHALTFISRRAAYPNARARELLAWEPRVSLEEGMARTEAWFRSEGLLSPSRRGSARRGRRPSRARARARRP